MSGRMITLVVVVMMGCTVAGFSLLRSSSGTVPDPGRTSTEIEDVGILCFGHVDVESGVIRLSPEVPGLLVEVPVKMNQSVPKGAVLMRLDDQPARLRFQQAEADLRDAQRQLDDARRLPGQHRERIDQQKAAVEVAFRRYNASKHQVARMQRLFRENKVKTSEVLATEEESAALEAAHDAEKHKLKELERVDPNIGVARAQALVDARQAQVELARHALAQCTLHAPENGKVLRVLARAGEMISPQSPIPALYFCPETPRIVRAEVSQPWVARVVPGQKVKLADEGDPSLRWSGTVDKISDWYTRRRSILRDPLEVNDVRTVECIIRPTSTHGLRIGQRLRLTILASAPDET